MIDAHSPALAQIAIGANPATLEAIAINYGLVREWLSDAYPLIFIKNEEKNQNPESSIKYPESSPDSYRGQNPAHNSWIKIFESLIGDDIVNHDKYAALPIHNVLRFMSEKIKQNMKRRK